MIALFRKHWVPATAVLLVFMIAAQPLWGLPPKGDDAFLHYFRIPSLSLLWQQGLPFSRWLPNLVYGYGSPLFNFYPPLSTILLTTLYWLTGQNGWLAYNLAYAIALLITAVAMYGLGQHLFGVSGGLLALIAYTLSPHILLQVYSRGSLSNALALAFFPLAAWTLLRVLKQPSPRRLVVAIVALTLVLLSHTAASLIFIPLLLVWGLGTVIIPNPARLALHPARLKTILLAVGIALALSSFTWLPGLSEIDSTLYSAALAPDKVDFRSHFADWPLGPVPVVDGVSNAPLPKSIGLMQLVWGGLATAAAGWGLGAGWRKKRPFSRLDWLIVVTGLLGLGTLFFTTPFSSWFWENIEPLRQLQFPWRLLDQSAFFLALACGWWGRFILVNAEGSAKKGRSISLLQILVPGLTILVALGNALPYLYPPRLTSLPKRPSLADASRWQQDNGIWGLTGWGEYSAATVSVWPDAPPFPGADAGAMLSQKLSPPIGVTVLEAAGGLLDATWVIAAQETAVVTPFIHHFPGWQATLDGEPLPIGVDETGRIQLIVPAGTHSLTLSWGRTPVRWVADGLSLASLLLVLGMLIWPQPHLSAKSVKKAKNELKTMPSSRALWAIPLILLFGFGLKVGWLDRSNTFLVVHPSPEQIPGMAVPKAQNFGDMIYLSGYELSEPDRLTLVWYAPQTVDAVYEVVVTLADARGAPVKEIVNRLPGQNITSSWEAGQFTRDVYQLPLNEREAPAGYQLTVALRHESTREWVPLLDGEPGVLATGIGQLKRPPPKTAVLRQATPIGAVFGQTIELSGIVLPASIPAGERLEVILCWRALAGMDQDYTVFIHLLNPDGSLAAGSDGQPLAGLYPTSYWSAGELITDSRIWLPPLENGRYQVEVGWYQLATGERLPVTGNRAALGDRVLIGEIEIGGD